MYASKGRFFSNSRLVPRSARARPAVRDDAAGVDPQVAGDGRHVDQPLPDLPPRHIAVFRDGDVDLGQDLQTGARAGDDADDAARPERVTPILQDTVLFRTGEGRLRRNPRQMPGGRFGDAALAVAVAQ